MGEDVNSTIDRLSAPPPKPEPLPKLRSTTGLDVYDGKNLGVIKQRREARLNIDHATGADMVGKIVVCGPKLTEEQRREIHRTELKRHVRSDTLRRFDRDEEGRIRFRHDGQVQTHTDGSRSYAWVDAIEYHKAATDLQATARTELGALRRLVSNNAPGDETRRPAPGGGFGGSATVAPIDALAVRHVIRKQRGSWLRRAARLVVVAGLVILTVTTAVATTFILMTRTPRGARQLAQTQAQAQAQQPGPSDAPPSRAAGQEPPGPEPRHRTFAEWQAYLQNAAEDPSAIADAGSADRDSPQAPTARRRRHRPTQ